MNQPQKPVRIRRSPRPRLPSAKKIPQLYRLIDDALQEAARGTDCRFYRLSVLPLTERAAHWLTPDQRYFPGVAQSFFIPLTSGSYQHQTTYPSSPDYEIFLSQSALVEVSCLTHLRLEGLPSSQSLDPVHLPMSVSVQHGFTHALERPGAAATLIGFKQPFREDFLRLIVTVVGSNPDHNQYCADCSRPAIDKFCTLNYGDLALLDESPATIRPHT